MAWDRQLEVRTSAGPVRYRDSGAGEPLVFVHGTLADGQLWRKVIPLLADRYRCIVPDWPLGSHQAAMKPEADLSPAGLVAIVVEFVDALGLEEVTLVGNDTGGALCQLVAAAHPDRVSRLVLTPCDAYENFPPRLLFLPLQVAARLPGGLVVLLSTLRLRPIQRLPFSLAGLSKRLDTELVTAWLQPALTDRGVRRDLAKWLLGLHRRYTLEAASKLRGFDRPVLIAWAPEARFFKMRYGERLAAEIPTARLERIDDAYTFVSEDQPERTAEVIAAFMTLGAPDRSQSS
jgi:pimeloyl-ACP methyl ester carboxylesterase